MVQALLRAVAHAGSFFTGLYGSLFLYRLFLSPLRSFPGPLVAKLSNLGFSAQLRKLDSHRELLKLHQKHGEFVRVGSSDLSIIHPKATNVIYGRKSRCTKADWYDLTYPMVSMQTTRQRSEHDKRRLVWGGAFNDSVLRGYEQRIAIYQDQLVKHIAGLDGSPTNVTELFGLYGFDVMGDLAFGASFDMLREIEQHWAVKLLHKGMEPLGFMLPTWCFRVLLAIPGATKDWFAFKDFCCEKLDRRMKTKVENPNIMSFLLEPWKDRTPKGHDMNMLQGDSQLIVVPGSDTTASALTSIFYELVNSPNTFAPLRAELEFAVKGQELLTNHGSQKLSLLNGVICETLRLHPPAGLLQRKTPPEGIMIGETYVPGHTTVFCPQYVAGRNASSFRPERWFEKPEMIKEPSAYAPFSTGTYNCIGKPLALLNLRTTLTKLILEFDVSFAPGYDRTTFETNARTQFNTNPGELFLTFKERYK